MTAEELFLSKYGNKITASDSWVIRFAEEYAEMKLKLIIDQPPSNCSAISPNDIQKEAEKYQQSTRLRMSMERIAFAQGALWVRSLFMPNDR